MITTLADEAIVFDVSRWALYSSANFRGARGSPADHLATPPIYMAFDCLHLRGKDLRERPLHVRRNALEGVLEGQDLVLPARRFGEDGPPCSSA